MDGRTQEAGAERSQSLRVGVVLRRRPGVTRWVAASWTAIGLLPAAPEGLAAGDVLREEGGEADIYAGAATLTLWRTDTEAYLTSLNGRPPAVFAILRRPPLADPAARPDLLAVTASAYEAQDFADNGEDIVEKLAMPPALEAWIAAFVAAHHREEAFVKRRRRDHEMPEQDGIGDARIRQTADVYRAPGSIRRGGS